MNQIPIKLGPLALLLTVISICLTVMAILTFSTANADQAMAKSFADSTKTRYALEQEGQKFLQEADEALLSGGSLQDLGDVQVKDGGAEKTLTKDGYHLTIRLVPAGDDGYDVAEWSFEKEWKEKDTIDGLWMPQ